MVELENLKQYVDNKKNAGLVSICPLYEIPTEENGANLLNTKLAETYEFANEAEADGLINEAKESPNFYSISKSYKEPKMAKNGELIKEGYYLVKIVYKVKY